MWVRAVVSRVKRCKVMCALLRCSLHYPYMPPLPGFASSIVYVLNSSPSISYVLIVIIVVILIELVTVLVILCHYTANRIGCSNRNMFQRHVKMVSNNLSTLNAFTAGLVERALKHNLEGVLAWFSRVLAINYSYFSVVGLKAVKADEMSSFETTSPSIVSFCYCHL